MKHKMVKLLLDSISLTFYEKSDIMKKLDAGILSEKQIIDAIEIFEEEQREIALLADKGQEAIDSLAKMQKKASEEMQILLSKYPEYAIQ